MRVAMASSGGHVDRPNQDHVGAVPGAVVLLDGAGIPGSDAVCHHGVVWYVHRLGASLLERLSRRPGADLRELLAESIDVVARRHGRTCDLASPLSPQASVAVVRTGEDRVDHLVLADAFVVLDRSGSGPQVVTDPREVTVRSECLSALSGVPAGTSEHERVLASVRDAFRARRNQPGGYWVAKDDPHAALQAVSGSAPLGSVDGAALLSNGASRVVDPYGLLDWPEVLELARSRGPESVVRRVREAEAEGRLAGPDDEPLAPDDATVAWCERLGAAADP